MINSPKGMDSFRVPGPKQAAYLDYTETDAETLAHIKENKRIVIMMYAFKGPPKYSVLMVAQGPAKPDHWNSSAFRNLTSLNDLPGMNKTH